MVHFIDYKTQVYAFSFNIQTPLCPRVSTKVPSKVVCRVRVRMRVRVRVQLWSCRCSRHCSRCVRVVCLHQAVHELVSFGDDDKV